MTNKFRVEAYENGWQFYFDNPYASGVKVDDASPKFNPCRTDFQNGFYAAKECHERAMHYVRIGKPAY